MKNTRSAFFLVTAALTFIPALAQATSLSALTAATTGNTIDNGGQQQLWEWNSIGAGYGLFLYSSATTANGAVLFVQSLGANSTSGSINSSIGINNTRTGTNSTNYGLSSLASGATHNYGLYGEAAGGNAGDAGVWGDEEAGSGASYGVLGTNNSPTGYAGYFNNTGGGYSAAFMGGKVGIGTASPANLLDIGSGGGIHITSGVPSSTSMALYNNSGTLTWNGIALATGSSVSGTTNYIPVFTGASSLGNSAIYQSSGSIGIGTTSPQSLLQVSGGEVQVGTSGASCVAGNNGAIRFSSSTLYYCTGTTWTAVGGGGSSQWTTSGSNIYYTTGNVGINTTSPGATLAVSAATVNGNDSTYAIRAMDGSNANKGLLFGYDDTDNAGLIASINSGTAWTNTIINASSGNVGIGTASPSYTLHVNGSVAGVGAYNSLSDVRHKKNVQPLDSGLKEVEQLKPVTFEWKDDTLNRSIHGKTVLHPLEPSMQGKQIGFVAQDVEKILPSVVVTEPNAENTKGMKYSELIPVLVKAIQEQQVEIDELKKTNAGMKAKLGM